MFWNKKLKKQIADLQDENIKLSQELSTQITETTKLLDNEKKFFFDYFVPKVTGEYYKRNFTPDWSSYWHDCYKYTHISYHIFLLKEHPRIVEIAFGLIAKADFSVIREMMIKSNWTWGGDGYQPTEADLASTVFELISVKSIEKHNNAACVSGGIEIEIEPFDDINYEGVLKFDDIEIARYKTKSKV